MRFVCLLLVSSLMIASCKKKEDLGKVNETIYVRSNGADMPVYLHGNVASNVMILIVHGGPGGTGLEYRSGKYAEALEARYGMAYWDQRGQGMSQGKYKTDDVIIENMVIDMNAVINSLKAKYGSGLKVIALGHSWGGTLSAKFMITAGLQQNLAGWIEADGAHDIPKLNRDAVAMFKSEAQTQIGLGNNVDNWQGILDWANAIDTNNITVEQGGEINAKARDAEQWLLDDGFIQASEGGGIRPPLLLGPTNPLIANISGRQTSKKLDEVEYLSMTKELNRVTLPTLILWGKYDFVVPPTLAYDCFNEISSTQKKLVIFNKSGHSPMDNEWEAFTNEVVAFAESLK
ncbi:MAG: hypothetical protein CL840_02365 [Crocinitomicaceae bacterium]|nr:hypothetical protein [Crocinitomicaceae bacterium]